MTNPTADLVETVQNKINQCKDIPETCLIEQDTCRKDGCSLSVNEIQKRLIIDGDKLLHKEGQKFCDYLLIASNNDENDKYVKDCVSPIEFKSGTVSSTGNIAKQLQGGANLADKLTPLNFINLRPILVAAHMRKKTRREFKTIKTKFRSKKKALIIMSPKGSLTKDILFK